MVKYYEILEKRENGDEGMEVKVGRERDGCIALHWMIMACGRWGLVNSCCWGLYSTS